MAEKPLHYFSGSIIGGHGKGSGRSKTYDPNGAGDLLIGHGRGLFDQNEDMGGDLTDPSTGMPYDTSTFDVLEESHDPKDHRFDEVNPLDYDVDDQYRDVLPPMKEKRDDAARWLAENDVAAQLIESSQQLPIDDQSIRAA